MSGETERDVSAWTVDSAHSHVLDMIAASDRRYLDNFAAIQREVSDALTAREKVTVEIVRRYDNLFDAHEQALRDHVAEVKTNTASALADLQRNTDNALLSREKFSNETDRRYQDRFTAQEHAVEVALTERATAVEVALVAVKSEFHEHLSQAREEARTALGAAERARDIQITGDRRALDIASDQMDERLTKVNEFRAALADAQAQMIPRAEVKLMMDGLTARVEILTGTINTQGQQVVELRSTLAGQGKGESDQQRTLERNRTLLLGVVGVALTMVIIAVSLFVGLRSRTTVVNPPAPAGTTAR